MNENFVYYMQSSKKSANTIKTYTTHIAKMLNFVKKPENEITYMDLLRWQSSLTVSANSVRLEIASVQAYFKFLTKSKIIAENPAIDLEKPRVNPKQKPYMSAEDVRALVNASRTDRDKAIILTFCTTGMRISELTSIPVSEYNNIKQSREFVITGKGSKERSVFFNDEVIEAIDKYLTTRNDDCPYLFCSFKHTKIDSEAFSRTLKSTARRAGLSYADSISNHCLRSASATMYAEAGVPIEDIRDLLGHASIATTNIYLKSCKRNIRNAVMQKVF